MPGLARATLLILFFLSGFAGLIYQSVWARYLGTFLGHAAYAQSLVLIIFMGGLALGAWWASALSRRLTNLLRAYAITEGLIGLAGLAFHSVFIAATSFAYDTALPSISDPALANAFKWGLAALLIFPQTVLLGMTFPFMTAGLIRRDASLPGTTVAMLYFTNSLGAALGVLFAIFVFVPTVGLPGTTLTAGLIGVAVAIAIWPLARGSGHASKPAVASGAPRADRPRGLLWGLLGAAFITGAASFVYEIVWIRMLSLVLGSSTHAFELMLSAFIFGLAFGGLWIRRRIDQLDQPLRFVGWVQVLMGLTALLTLPIYIHAFDWMAFLRHGLALTEQGYSLFLVASHGIALIVMLPTTFLAGMTLPLFTYALLQRGGGEQSIGRIYAANTLGAIVGVVIAVHVGLPKLGIELTLAAAALVDIALGLILIRLTVPRRLLEPLAASVLGAGGLVLIVTFVQLDPARLASGPFRLGGKQLPDDTEVLVHRDGKTASVTTYRAASGVVAIATNGKVDGGIQMDPARAPAADETTMTMLAVLPLSYRPEARRAAVIGYGTGMTTDVLLASPHLETVHTIELEPAMVEGAQPFLTTLTRVANDPRSKIIFEDAKAFFAMEPAPYDLIVSEPSNPWVSGVASLYTTEFYARAKDALADGGIFVQWAHLYEMDLALLSSIYRALRRQFPEIALYFSRELDIIFVASADGPLPPLSEAPFRFHGQGWPELGLAGLGDLKIRRILETEVGDALFQAFPAVANSDYFPVVSLRAPKSFYLRESAGAVSRLGAFEAPLIELLSGETPPWAQWSPDRATQATIAQRRREALDVLAALDPHRDRPVPEAWVKDLLVLGACGRGMSESAWRSVVHRLAGATLPFATPDELKALWIQPAAPVWACPERSARMDAALELYRAVAQRERAQIIAAASALLASEQPHPPAVQAYATAVALAAQLGLGEVEAALRTLRQYGEALAHYSNRDLQLLILREVLVAAGNAP